MKELNWETIKHGEIGFLSRTPIFGGWLVKFYDDVQTADPNRGLVTGWEWRTTMTFVPDPNHEWDLNEDYSPKPTT